jgi:hypothetical protein
VNARLPEMDTLYNSETQLINEIDSLLTNIIKVTEKWESVSQIHLLASVFVVQLPNIHQIERLSSMKYILCVKLNCFIFQKLQKHQKSFLGEFEILMKLAHQVSESAAKSSSSVDSSAQFDLSRFEVLLIHYQLKNEILYQNFLT